jgi:uncharacterized RmlC-like cupin family protein
MTAVCVRHTSAERTGAQGENHAFGPAVTQESAGTKALCQTWLTLRPGVLGRWHVHAGHESVVAIVDGEADAWYGEDMTHVRLRPGDQLYLPAGCPHVAYSEHGCRIVLARTDPTESESVELRPDLDVAFAERWHGAEALVDRLRAVS